MNRISDSETLETLVEFSEKTGEIVRSEYDEPSPCKATIEKRFGSWGNAIDAAGIPHDFIECPHEDCGNLYENIGKHWRWKTTHRPEITEEQHEIITGLMMGDAYSRFDDSNSSISLRMTNKKFLDWVDRKMGVLSKGVEFHMSAEECAKRDRESGFNPGAKAENYKDKYKWDSCAHPGFNQYRGWYSSKGKEFPENLRLTPLVLKMWFVCDGGTEINGDRRRVKITTCNEAHREDYFVSKFSDVGFDVKTNLKKRKRSDELSLYFGMDESIEVWEYMGRKVPGFEHKWETLR